MALPDWYVCDQVAFKEPEPNNVIAPSRAHQALTSKNSLKYLR